MKQTRFLLFAILCCLAIGSLGVPATLGAVPADILKTADALDREGKYPEGEQLLLNSLPVFADKAEIYWRLSRAILNEGDTGILKGTCTRDQALQLFKDGESYGDLAISHNPSNPNGYFWKAANIAIWGQTKGVLEALFLAGGVRDTLRQALQVDPALPQAYYLLGELYEKLPGWPLSFGNVEYSVSLGRKAVDLMESQIASGILGERYYVGHIALASHLWARNWDLRQRESARRDIARQFAERIDPVEKQCFYEGTIPLKSMSDREEALEILRMVIAVLAQKSIRVLHDETDLRKARLLLTAFTGNN